MWGAPDPLDAPLGRGDDLLKGRAVLKDSDLSTRLPAQDLARARAFYAEKLGVKPVEERPGGLRYQCGSGRYFLFESVGAASGTHIQMAWRSTTSRPWSPSCDAVTWCSRRSTSPAFGRWRPSPRWRATTLGWRR